MESISKFGGLKATRPILKLVPLSPFLQIRGYYWRSTKNIENSNMEKLVSKNDLWFHNRVIIWHFQLSNL